MPFRHGALIAAGAVLALAGCSTTTVTRVRVREPKTTQQLRVNLVRIEAPSGTESIAASHGAYSDRSATKIWLDRITSIPDVKRTDFPSLVAADGERAEADQQEPMRYVADYHDDLSPKTYATRGIGMKWSCLPTIQKERSVVLELQMDDIEFDGWVDYQAQRNEGGKRAEVALRQPVFRGRTQNTTIRLGDGGGMTLGGLMRTESRAPGSREPAKGRCLLYLVTAEIVDEP